jgi:Fe-S-cluster containining protein
MTSEDKKAAVLGMLDSLYAHCDRVIETMPTHIVDADNVERPIACAIGCNYCCRLEVGVTAAELLAIKNYLDTVLKGSLEKIKTRVRHRRREIGDKRGAAREKLGTVCPLLGDDGRCQVYPVRPLGCRSVASCSKELCQADAEAPRTGVKVPYSATLRYMVRALSVELHERQQTHFGLAGGAYELIRALTIASNEPDFEQRCLNGESVLAPARVPV